MVILEKTVDKKVQDAKVEVGELMNAVFMKATRLYDGRIEDAIQRHLPEDDDVDVLEGLDMEACIKEVQEEMGLLPDDGLSDPVSCLDLIPYDFSYLDKMLSSPDIPSYANPVVDELLQQEVGDGSAEGIVEADPVRFAPPRLVDEDIEEPPMQTDQAQHPESQEEDLDPLIV